MGQFIAYAFVAGVALGVALIGVFGVILFAAALVGCACQWFAR